MLVWTDTLEAKMSSLIRGSLSEHSEPLVTFCESPRFGPVVFTRLASPLDAALDTNKTPIRTHSPHSTRESYEPLADASQSEHWR